MYNIFNLKKTALRMNCLYIILFFNIVDGIVQTCIKSWNQLLYPRAIEEFRLSRSRQRSKTSYRSFIHREISPSYREFTSPIRHILPIHNVKINSNNLFVNFRWTFTFCVEKSYDGTHLAFGETLDGRCHFKHFSLKQNWF